MFRRYAVLEPSLRRPVAGVVLLSLIIVGGVVGALLAAPQPIDQRWVEYDQPTRIGRLDDAAGTITRSVTLDGTPIVYDDTVPVTFSRCGPVAEVEAISSRTWVLTADADADAYLGIEGQTITIIIEPADCTQFELGYALPAEIIAALDAAGGGLVSIRFALDPLDDQLGPIVIETEQFVRADNYPGSLFAEVEALPVVAS